MEETAKDTRNAAVESAVTEMNELQAFNETYILGRQKMRCSLLEKLLIGMLML